MSTPKTTPEPKNAPKTAAWPSWVIFHEKRPLTATLRDTRADAIDGFTGNGFTWDKAKQLGFRAAKVLITEIA